MNPIVLHISAAADASLKTVLTPLEQAAKKARQVVRKEMDGLASDTGKGAKSGTSAASKAYEQLEKEFAKREAGMAREAEKASRQRERAALREFDARARASAKARAQEEKDIASLARAAERADQKRAQNAKRAQDKSDRDFVRGARGFAGDVGNGVRRMAGRALGMGRELVGGMGVDLSPSSLLGKSVDLNKMATQIANSGFMAQGKSANLGDVKSIENSIRSTGTSTAKDYGEVARGLEAFLGVTGDLPGGIAILEQLGKTSNATATDMEELGQLAGMLRKEFGDAPDAVEKVDLALRNLAKGGLLGNVELKDLAQFGGRISSKTGFFEGDANKTMGQLQAMAQISMLGGRVDAAEATNSVARFAEQMGNANVQKNIRSVMGADYSVYADKGHTKMKAPEQLMKELVGGAGGDQEKLASMFKNVMSKSVLEGFNKLYMDAGGGAKGLAAISDTFTKFGGSLSKEQVESANNLAKGSDAAKAQELTNKLVDAFGRLVPAAEKLFPLVEQGVNAFAGLVEWGSNNPLAAATAALAAEVGSAGIGAALRGAVTGDLKGALTGATFTIAAATLIVGMMAIEQDVKNRHLSEEDVLRTETTARNAKNTALMTGSGSMKEADRMIEATQGRLNKALMANSSESFARGLSTDEQYQAAADIEHLPELMNALRDAVETKKALSAEGAHNTDQDERYRLLARYSQTGGKNDADDAAMSRIIAQSNEKTQAGFEAALGVALGRELVVRVSNMPAGGMGGDLVNQSGRRE